MKNKVRVRGREGGGTQEEEDWMKTLEGLITEKKGHSAEVECVEEEKQGEVESGGRHGGRGSTWRRGPKQNPRGLIAEEEECSAEVRYLMNVGLGWVGRSHKD